MDFSDFTKIIQPTKLTRQKRWFETPKEFVQLEQQALWLYGLKVMMTDCLSVDQGSIPYRVVKSIVNIIWGCSSVGRALALQARGRGFNSHQFH